jgi:hypothetical protein
VIDNDVTINHLTYLCAVACFAALAVCIVIARFSSASPTSRLASFFSLKRSELSVVGWRLRNAAVWFASLGCAFGLASYFS